MSVMWFASYSKISKQRTTECKFFPKLKNAKAFFKENNINGYIVRTEDKGGLSTAHKSSIVFITEDFVPSAKEQLIMKNLEI